MFKGNKQESGMSREFLTAASTDIKKGDALTFASGYVTPVTAAITAATPILIADEAIVTAASEHKKILCTVVTPEQEFLADCDADTAQAQVGGAYKFKAAGVVDNATAGGPCRVVSILPNKKAVIRFY